MKNLYDLFLNNCNQEEIKNIFSIQKDQSEEFGANAIISKYSFDRKYEVDSYIFYKKINKEDFFINFNIDYIFFSIESTFKDFLNFSTRIGYIPKIKKYYLEFYIENKIKKEQVLKSEFRFENNTLIHYENFNTLAIDIKSKKNLINDDETYILGNINVIQLIFDNIYESELTKELLFLNYDLTTESDELLNELYNHLSILNSIKK